MKIDPPSDILGAIVSSQIDTEDEAKGDRKVGLSFQEIIANICESDLIPNIAKADILGIFIVYAHSVSRSEFEVGYDQY